MSPRHAPRSDAASTAAVLFGAVATLHLTSPAWATEMRSLAFEVVDLVYSSTNLEGRPVSFGGEARRVEGDVVSLQVEETATEIRIELSGDILFDFDASDLRPSATPTLERVAELLGEYRDAVVRIEGHTDAKGAESYNLALSQRRADSVKAWLVRKGVTTAALGARGLGESVPVAPNETPDGADDPEGRQRNRRVEIVVSKP